MSERRRRRLKQKETSDKSSSDGERSQKMSEKISSREIRDRSKDRSREKKRTYDKTRSRTNRDERSVSKGRRQRSPDRGSRSENRRDPKDPRESRDAYSNKQRTTEPESLTEKPGRRSINVQEPNSTSQEEIPNKFSSSSSYKRRWRFDSPPKDANSIPKASGFSTDANSTANPAPGIMATSSPANANSPSNLSTIAQKIGLTPDQEKAARELYIGNLPPGIDVQDLIEFLNLSLQNLKISALPGNPIVKSWKSSDGHFAFAEFRSMEEANAGMQLNGMNCLGYGLKVGRPKTFPQELHQLLATHYQQQPTEVPTPAVISEQPAPAFPVFDNSINLASTSSEVYIEGVPTALSAWSAPSGAGFSDGPAIPLRLAMMGLPPCADNLMRQLLTSFGVLHYFNVVRNEAIKPVPIVFFEYDSLKSQHAALTHLDRIKFNGNEIRIMKIEDAMNEPQFQEILLKATYASLQDVGGGLMRIQIPTKILMLTNMYSKSKAALDDKELDEICLDIREECTDCGQILAIEVPKPFPGAPPRETWSGEIGSAFVEFETVEGSAKARALLMGRKFEGRLVEAHYFSERKFNAKEFKFPSANFSRDDSSLFAPDLTQGETEQENMEQEKEEERLKEQGLCGTEETGDLADELDDFAVMAR